MPLPARLVSPGEEVYMCAPSTGRHDQNGAATVRPGGPGR